MKKYWSCSKFADWLRGVPKPPSETPEHWDAWEKKAKRNKYRYWLAEEGLDYLEAFIYFPVNSMKMVFWYLNNRWVTKSHALTSNLPRGKWYDLDARLLHAVFDELVNFVECELALEFVVCSEEEQKKYKIPWYRAIFRINAWRSPEAGMAYLQWASDLKNDNRLVDDSDYGKPTSQALAAQEILKLYLWWKEERPKRPDPGDVSGVDEYYTQKRKESENGDDSSLNLMLKGMYNEDLHNRFNRYREIENSQEDEDTAMLIRLIQIRHSLWT